MTRRTFVVLILWSGSALGEPAKPNTAAEVPGALVPKNGTGTEYRFDAPNFVVVVGQFDKLVITNPDLNLNRELPLVSAGCPPPLTANRTGPFLCADLSPLGLTLANLPDRRVFTFRLEKAGAAPVDGDFSLGPPPVQPTAPVPSGAGNGSRQEVAASDSSDSCAKHQSKAFPVPCDAFKEALRGVAESLDADDRAAWVERHYDMGPRNIYDQDAALIIYDEAGTSAWPVPLLDEEDAVALLIVPRARPVGEVKVRKCKQGADVRVGGRELAGVRISPKAAGVGVGDAVPVQLRNCGSDEGIQVTFKVETEEVSISLPTLALYRLTFGLGLFYDLARVSQFEARAVKGESVPVIIEDRHNVGLDAAAFVSLRLAKVDSVRRRSFWQAIALAVGFSVTHPTDHLYLALHLEPFPGVGFLAGWHAFRAQSLAGGYAPQDRLAANDLVVDKRWKWGPREDEVWPVFFGVNLDASVLGAILQKLSQ